MKACPLEAQVCRQHSAGRPWPCRQRRSPARSRNGSASASAEGIPLARRAPELRSQRGGRVRRGIIHNDDFARFVACRRLSLWKRREFVALGEGGFESFNGLRHRLIRCELRYDRARVAEFAALLGYYDERAAPKGDPKML